MKPGDSKEFEAEYIVTEADVLAGSVKNSVTAKGNPPDDDIPDPEEEDEVERTHYYRDTTAPQIHKPALLGGIRIYHLQDHGEERR